ncbi:MAG: HAMP domain-containing protein [Candidatus Omnitrophica bacterium]|nr:HAMP domain-containing protein [Candidatus Omnitrophota bacterium]
MADNFENKRKNYFIKKKFQRDFIIKFCSLVILGSAISGSIIYLMSMSAVTTTFENLRLVIKSTADYILPAVLLSSAVVIILIGFAAIIVTLFTSHRIAGPLYRLEKDIDEIASGNLRKKVNLRKTDELKALAASLNGMTGKLRSDIEGVKNIVSEIEYGVGSPDLKEKIEKLKSILSNFMT